MNPTSLRYIRSLCSVAFLALSACTTAEILQMQLQQHQPPLLAKVWFDTGCPQYDIKVLSWTADYRAAQVNACGRIRHYQDISGNHQDPNWIDTTTLGGERSDPGSAAAYPFFFSCASSRGHLRLEQRRGLGRVLRRHQLLLQRGHVGLQLLHFLGARSARRRPAGDGTPARVTRAWSVSFSRFSFWNCAWASIAFRLASVSSSRTFFTALDSARSRSISSESFFTVASATLFPPSWAES